MSLKIKKESSLKTILLLKFVTLDLNVTIFRDSYSDLIMTSYRYYTEKSLYHLALTNLL